MQAQSKVSVSIIAALSSGFKTAFTSAETQMSALGKTAKDLGDKVGNITAFRRQQEAAKQTGEEWKRTKERAEALRAAMNGAGTNFDTSITKAKDAAKQAAAALKLAKDQVVILKDAQKQAGAAGAEHKAKLDAAKDAAKQAGIAAKTAAKDVDSLTRAQRHSEQAALRQKSELTRLENEAKRLGGAFTEQRAKLGDMSRAMQRQGIDVSRLSQEYTRLKGAAKQAIDRQTSAEASLKRQAAMVNNMHTAWKGIGSAITYASTTAAAIKYGPVGASVKEAKTYETEAAKIDALGMGDEVTKKAIEFAGTIKGAGTSLTDNVTLMGDALSAFADLHHAEIATPILAKMKFANEAFFGSDKGHENESKFMDMLKVIELKGGAKDEESFKKHANYIQQVVVGSRGRVSAEEYRHVVSRGGIAAAGMRDDAFYYQLEPLIQMLGSGDAVGTGLSASYNSMYQGRTTKRAANNLEKYGLIADKSKVEEDKAGQIAHLNPGALKGSKLFAESQYDWVKQILLPTLAEKGVTDKQEIIDVIGSIISNKTGAAMITQMYLQQAQIDKDIHRNKTTFDIDKLDAKARTMTTGKEILAEKGVDDTKKNVGDQMLPAYTTALQGATSALNSFNKALSENPLLAKATAGAAVATTLGAGYVGGKMLKSAAGRILAAGAGAALPAAGAATTAAGAGTAATALGGAAAAGRMAATGSFLAKAGSVAKNGLLIGGAIYAGDAAAGAMGVGKDKVDTTQDARNWDRANWWEKTQSAIPRGIEKVGRMLWMDNIANQGASDRIAQETQYINDKYGKETNTFTAPPGGAVPMVSETAREALRVATEANKTAAERPNVTQTNSYNITINAQTQDAAGMVAEFQRELARAERKREADLRAGFFAKPQF